jgi:hypothetical protein
MIASYRCDKKIRSPTGNRTRVARVTGENASLYTMEDNIQCTSVFNTMNHCFCQTERGGGSGTVASSHPVQAQY